MVKKFALFDIDRTLFGGKWSIGVFVTHLLHDEGLFPDDCYQETVSAVKENLEGRISYRKRGEIIITNWAKGFTGRSRQWLLKKTHEYFQKDLKRYIYPGAKELISYLKKNHYYIVAISRAYRESISPIAHYLEIDEIIGTVFEVRRGVFTGRLENRMWEAGAKEHALMRMFSRVNLTTEESIAFGDTEDDYYMLKFVEYPITLNVNKDLERIATKRHWPIYNDLRTVLRDLQSGKFIPKQDWFHHYVKKYGHIIMDDAMLRDSLRNDDVFIRVVKRYVKPGKKILEVGCGLARTAISLSRAGYCVTAIDNDKNILRVAQINCFNYGKSIRLRLMDMFELSKYVKRRQFDLVTHGGVLEHFSDNQINILLDAQLRIAPLVIFSVPVESKRNDKYFRKDEMGHRYLWTKNEWVSFLKNSYRVLEAKVSRSLRKDDLIVVLKRKQL